MSASRTEVLKWAERVMSRKSGPAHLVLEVRENATSDEAQRAFHKIARASHPDLHRQALSAEELELVTSAYAAVAGAYMQVRSQATTTQPVGNAAPVAGPSAPAGRPTPIPVGTGRTPAVAVPAAGGASAPDGAGGGLASLSSVDAAQQMASKAVLYFRKAESALKRGDFKSALLQIKLAIAADPASTFLRNALAEVDAELRRGT